MEINSKSSSGNGKPEVSLSHVQRPGEYLRQIRVSQKKELAEVAAALKFPEKQLIALETDDYNALPEAPFIKGYYRSYAKYLGVDVSPVIQRFDDLYSNETGLSPNHTLKDSPIKLMGRLSRSGKPNRKWFKRFIIFIIIVILLWLIVWYIGSRKVAKDINENEVITAESNNPALTVNQNQPTTGVSSGDTLQLEFSHPTSVMITDATGKTLAQGRQSDPITLQGQAPFSIRLDDANAVKLKLNNETISLNSYTKASGIADFKISP